jgi:hypothetical protein
LAAAVLGLDRQPGSPLAKALDLVVAQYLAGVPDGSGHEGALRPFDPDRDLLVITTDPSAPASVRAGLAIQRGARKLREITGMILINRTREGATPLPRGTARLRCIASVKPQVRGYLTSSPVIVRPISIRWISLVPSKMVKILDYRAVSAGQRAA